MSSDLIRIPCVFMRGGTSRGPFFLASDLPADPNQRDALLLSVMGAGHELEIDGIGGGNPLTSKVAIVGPSTVPGADVDYLFAQVRVEQQVVDTSPNCGNMLAAVVPFALESGMVAPRGDVTTLRVLTRNTGTLCDIEVQTPGGRVEYAGNARIDGVPGTAAPINISFLDTAGSVCGALFPTGNLVDRFDDVDVTCMDNGMPVVIMRATDLGVSGYESRDELNANAALKKRIESIRLQAGPSMKLGDVAKKVVPKMCLVAKPLPSNGGAGGHISTRTFIPHDCHSAVGVLGAVTVATAAVMPGSVAHRFARPSAGARKNFSVQHPTGEFTVTLAMNPRDAAEVESASLLRTARMIMRGEVCIPGHVWEGR